MVKNHYGRVFYKKEEEYAHKASDSILGFLFPILRPQSVVAFGCGTGVFLKSAKELGAQTVLGLDGEYAKKFFLLDENEFLGKDLSKPINLERKFDLAISLEVAEHIVPDSAQCFVENITRHSDIVLFGAALPFQGGNTHVNEQMPTYWKQIFEKYGYEQIDCIRPRFWEDDDIPYFYRQNSFLYVRENSADDIRSRMSDLWHGEEMIHPTMWKLKNNKNYLFPFNRVKASSNVIIYGAGAAGKAFVSQIKKTNYASIVLWVDGAYTKFAEIGMPIKSPESCSTINCDCVVIAVEKESVANEIKEQLFEMGVPSDKVIWESPFYSY